MPMITDKRNDIEHLTEVLIAQLKYHEELLQCTCELKEMVTEDYDSDRMDKIIHERGLLIDRITSSKKYYDSVKENINFADNNIGNSYTETLLQQIRHVLNTTVTLDAENISLVKEYMKDITLNLEKIQENRHFINDLKKHNSNQPLFVDVCG
jgi:hypothetical protein